VGCCVNRLRRDIGVDCRGGSGANGLRGELISGGEMVLMVSGGVLVCRGDMVLMVSGGCWFRGGMVLMVSVFSGGCWC
jgi:hypothetical protein